MNNFLIATRLKFLIGLLCAMMLGIGLLGMRSTNASNEALKSVYADRTVALSQLTQVLRYNLRNQVAVVSAAGDIRPEYAEKYLAEILDNAAGLTKEWDAYEATFLTDDEKALVARFKQHRTAFLEGVLKPTQAALAAKEGKDSKELARLAFDVMPALYQPMREDLNALLKLQVDEAKNVYETQAASYRLMVVLSTTTLVVALLLSSTFGYFLIRGIARSLNQAQALADAVAQGDLTQQIEPQGRDEVARLIESMASMRQALMRVVSNVRQGSQGVATASAEIAQGNHDLSARTENQASALEQTAASMEELGSTVSHNADNARQANQLAQNASAVATKGGEVVNQVVETMKGINDSSRRIADIISVIDGIAFQTNILALNAAVEAARAGDQGRGFAVVASEVRALAGRSAEAAKEIKSLISSSVERVEQGTALVDQAGITMNEVVGAIRRVNDIVGEISAASSEQAAGVNQVGEAVTQMDHVTQQNAALVEQMAAAASSLKSQAGDLVDVVAQFKLEHSEPTSPQHTPQHTPQRTPSLSPPRTPAALAAKPRPPIANGMAKKLASVKPALAKPAPQLTARAKPAPRPTPAGGDDEWETF